MTGTEWTDHVCENATVESFLYRQYNAAGRLSLYVPVPVLAGRNENKIGGATSLPLASPSNGSDVAAVSVLAATRQST